MTNADEFYEITRPDIPKKKRVVIKIGSSSLTHPETNDMDYNKIEVLVREICNIRNSGKDVVLVTSGSISLGKKAFINSHDYEHIPMKQALAAVGQARLMSVYQKIFAEYNQVCAQILMTKDTITNDTNRKNAKNTFEELLKMGVVPVVNENDTISTYEIKFGDNDTLSAIVASLIGADLLILLSDIDGLYTANPREDKNAKFISTVEKIDEKIMNMGSNHTGSSVGTGGMHTKLNAGRIATASGLDMIIANASDIHVIHRLMDGREFGTFFKANKDENFNLVEIAKGLNED